MKVKIPEVYKAFNQPTQWATLTFTLPPTSIILDSCIHNKHLLVGKAFYELSSQNQAAGSLLPISEKIHLLHPSLYQTFLHIHSPF